MKLTTLLLTIAFLQVHAAGSAQNVTISGKDIPLKHVFNAIKQQTGFSVFYTKDILEDSKPVTLSAYNMPLQELLQWVFKEQPVSFTISEKNIILSYQSKTIPQIERLIVNMPGVSGRIVDADGQPLSNVSIRVRGTKRGTTSGSDGQFLLDVKEGEILDISAVGFSPIVLRLNGEIFQVISAERSRNQQTDKEDLSGKSQLVVAAKQYVLIRMVRVSAVLEEAVIFNGYQKIKQKYLTGSVTSLNMDSIMQPGFNTVDKMLEGRVPGLTYMQNSGQSGAAPKLRIRGTSTIMGSREPLWVVDGIVRTNPIPIPADRINDPDFVNLLGNAISGLNPYDIEQIDVLKDATAAALYGVRAANGVIVITTKRGKPGPPVFNYNVTGTYTRRPRYSDRSIYMMDSRERVDVSRELIEKQMVLRGGGLVAYEKAIADYYAGLIDYDSFQKQVDRAETLNTDWLGHTMRDVFATNHTLSVSGGSAAASYRASVGYQSEPGVIRKESNDRYTALLNVLLSHRKFKAEFNIQMSAGKRRYTPQEVGVLNYAYGTSRAIPLYNEDGSLYYYSTVNSNTAHTTKFYDFNTMNIINEMDHTGDRIENSEYIARLNLNYEIANGIQFNSTLAYTGGNAEQITWFEDRTEWAAQLRSRAWDAVNGTFTESRDPLPFGGELRQLTARKQNYTVNGRFDFSKFLDQRKKHQLTAALGAEMLSNRNNGTNRITRGYYPNRGHSFANIDLTKYKDYGSWLQTYGLPMITIDLQNSLRSFLTSTYVFDDRIVISATTSQEYSNAFGSRSNEKFLPTWALSGRWNLHEDLLSQQSWIEYAALRLSYGTQGNMLQGQTPYTIIKKESINTYYNAMAASVTSFPNPDLRWEKKHDYNTSLEFSLLKGKIRGSLGYFYSKTSNAFLTKKVSAANGAPRNSYVVNGGSVENQGVELDLHFRIINNEGSGNRKGFSWRFDPQLGQVFNKLINNKLNSRNVMVDDAILTFQEYLNGTVPVNGKSVNTFYSYRFKTLDPNYGYPVFYGAEPENKTALTAQYNKMTKEEVFNIVMVESGKREPVLQGGINNTFLYRNWSLDVTFTYSVGNKIRLLQIASGNYGTFRPSSQQNIRKEFTERWRYPGDENITNIPAVQGGAAINDQDKSAWWNNASYWVTRPFATDYYQMYDNADLRVVKGDYLKLQSVRLAHTFSREICSKWHVKGATVAITGNNIFTIAHQALRGQDPSQSGSAPNINLSIRPVYAINFNLSF
ncbi:SusC/RagA family TonB-linked outer membrane protein [Pseudobacter ginsenosidimutans]|nr:SusC/RagA family TonB-linked outer membrane protein [Pseudobacter ginsenosidimutans]